MEHGRILGMHISWWLFIILLAILFIAFFEAKPRNRKNRKKNEDPLEILKRRYAGSEITTDEYEEMKKHLEDKNRN